MRRKLIVGVAIALMGGSLAVAEPAAAAPAVTVTPSTGLVDLQTVDVIASGFAPNATLGFCQGVFEPPVGQDDCIRPPGLIQADANGDLQLEVTVRRFGVRNGQTVDCLAPENECAIGVADSINIANTAVITPISFAPPPPPPAERGTIEVTPDEELGEGQAVEVVGTGFRPGATVEVLQCPAAPDDPTYCSEDFDVTVETDAAGGFTTDLTVTHLLGPFRRPGVDCRLAPGACVVAAAEVVDVPGTIVSAPLLSFVVLRPDLQVKRRSDGVIFFDDVYFPTAQNRRHSIPAGGRWTYALIAQNDGDHTDDLHLIGGAGESEFVDVEYFIGYYNVTEQVRNGSMVLHLEPGASLPFAVRFTAAPGAPPGDIGIQVTLTSQAPPYYYDWVFLEVFLPAPTP